MSRSLTGGTGDVNPQWYKFSVTQSGADTTTSTAFPLPVPKLQSNKKPTIVEILKVWWFAESDVEVDSQLTGVLTTKNFGTTAVGQADPNAIARMQVAVKITTSGQYVYVTPVQQDLTDGAGHGVLVATDNIYMQVNSSATSLSNVIYCWVLYRMKEVSLPEYIGIVQSQQS